MTIIASTPSGITAYQCIAIKHGIKAIKRGMRVNTAYTPKNCRAFAERVTGKTFKARDYDGMIAALDTKIADLKAQETTS